MAYWTSRYRHLILKQVVEIKNNLSTFYMYGSFFGEIPPCLLDRQWPAYNCCDSIPSLPTSDCWCVALSRGTVSVYRTGGDPHPYRHCLVRCIREALQSTNCGRLPNRVLPIVVYDWFTHVAISVIHR